MGEYKYENGDCFMLCVCGAISVASAVVLMIFGCAYDNILLCLGGYSAFITLAILSFILAYAVKNRQVRELTKEKEKTIKKKSNVFAFERYFTKLLSKEVA